MKGNYEGPYIMGLSVEGLSLSLQGSAKGYGLGFRV